MIPLSLLNPPPEPLLKRPLRPIHKLILPLLALGAVLAFASWWLYNAVGEHYWIFKDRAKSTQGLSEAEARKVMRQPPKFDIGPGDLHGGSPNDLWSGANFRPIPTFVVHKRVLLYQSAWSAAYLYIGFDGRVEHVVCAGT